MKSNLLTIRMINKDCDVLDVEIDMVVTYLFQGYSIIAGSLINWSDTDNNSLTLPDDDNLYLMNESIFNV